MSALCRTASRLFAVCLLSAALRSSNLDHHGSFLAVEAKSAGQLGSTTRIPFVVYGSRGGGDGRQSPGSDKRGGDKTRSNDDIGDRSAPVGLKPPRSNAVGDPDDDGSDDDEDSEDEMSEFDEWEDVYEEDDEHINLDVQSQESPSDEVKVELEFVEGSNDVDGEDYDEEGGHALFSTGGGVGVKSRTRRSGVASSTVVSSTALHHELQEQIVEAWLPHLYLPLATSNQQQLDYLMDHWTSIDASSRARLDRRTLYAGLLMEWTSQASSSAAESQSTATESKKRATMGGRTFLAPDTSHTLRATLSLANQPKWRKILSSSTSFTNGIRLYEDDSSEQKNKNGGKKSSSTLTLAMQETIACSLAHALGSGMLVLDDEIIARVRSDLIRQGFGEDQVKPAFLIQSIVQASSQRSITTLASDKKQKGASIADAMQRDMKNCLDDPFDERAIRSLEEMKDWEEKMYELQSEEQEPMPLVIFVRVDASPSLLKSKSAVEYLLNECQGADNKGKNLVILGKGVDGATGEMPTVTNLDRSSDGAQNEGSGEGRQSPQQQQQHPWFGFSQNNQNASGQNDPAGSKRFNIFLARTVDKDGNPGILGAVAPPSAGNLFPQMMAMQARERLQQMRGENSEGSDNDRAREALERWASLIQQQQDQQQGQDSRQQMPQFFNASLAHDKSNFNPSNPHQQAPAPPPSVVQETLQRALSDMLTKLARMNEAWADEEGGDESSPELHRALAQVLRNENLRRGIMENLSRAAPALSDPKCQGVMLSVYVPPHPMNGMPPFSPDGSNAEPPHQQPSQEEIENQDPNSHNMNSWFNRILSHQESGSNDQSDEGVSGAESGDADEDDSEKSRTRRVRTLAAAAAVQAAKSAETSREKDRQRESRATKNLRRLESACRPVPIPTPSDPVRARSWETWVDRELGAAIFRWNRIALNDKLSSHSLGLKRDIGSGVRVGSALRSMLSVRDITKEMDAVLQLAVELEAEHAQRRSLHKTNETGSLNSKDVDPSLGQLLLDDSEEMEASSDLLMLHPATLERAISGVCRITPSPYGGQSGSSQAVVHRTREETMALAQDKHEKALVSQVVNAQDIGVTYDMIGGLTEVKELLRQSITYPLKFPHLYSEGIAREAVKGVLLFGPPGTGKTMLAKAVATEGGASFLSVDASSVENKWLGESEKNAKAVFTLARRLSPCVVFIDEVDSLLSSREGTSDDSAHGTLTSVKTTMMSEWDGLNSGTNGQGKGADRVIVVGSTNRPFDLDEAVLRRFPRRLLVDLPDLETRAEILQVTLAENRLDPQVNLTQIAERLEGYTGSDIKEVCREAVVYISHEHAKVLDQGLGPQDDDEAPPQELRPVTAEDFERALSKLKKSVSETGRELARVYEWNDEYGEVKRNEKQSPKMMSMYL